MPATEIPDQLLCLYTTEVEEKSESYIIEIPEHELRTGEIDPEEKYRIAVLPSSGAQPDKEVVPSPPVQEGDVRDVEIEAIGQHGDGIARVERGYVVFIPGTEVGDEVTVEISKVVENFAFGKVIKSMNEKAEL